jgi:pimeloyl-ACP methyl ester carboxylesterase
MLKSILSGLAIIVVFAESLLAADGTIDLVVPLREERFYSLHSFLAECNLKLGTNFQYKASPDRELELRGLDKAALLLASEAGLLKVRFERERFIIEVPDRQDDAVRRQIRDRLGRLLRIPLNEWPVGLGLHIPAEFDPSRRTVLLIHGLGSGIAKLRPMQAAFERWGVQVLTFDFPNDGPIAWSGDRLSAELGKLVQQYPKVHLVVVAHSMGGLVARYVLETPSKNPGCVTDLFLLGTPNAGSRLAHAQPWLELIQTILPHPNHALDVLNDGLGEANDDLQPGSRFLSMLNAQARPTDIRYYSVMGRKPFLNEAQRSAAEAALDGAFEQRPVARGARDHVLGVLRSDEFREGRGDGAVALTSARLAGVKDEKVFDLNHTELLAAPVELQEDGEVFRWIVNKLGWERLGN